MSSTLRRLCAGGGAGNGGGGGIPPGRMVTHDARAAAYGDGIVTLRDVLQLERHIHTRARRYDDLYPLRGSHEPDPRSVRRRRHPADRRARRAWRGMDGSGVGAGVSVIARIRGHRAGRNSPPRASGARCTRALVHPDRIADFRRAVWNRPGARASVGRSAGRSGSSGNS